MSFTKILEARGWSEAKPFVYRKGSWVAVFDTSSWIEVGTDRTARVFDVPVPGAGQEEWCANIIEHLCKTDDLLHGMRRA